MNIARSLRLAAVAAALSMIAVPGASHAHPGPSHMVDGTGNAGLNAVVVTAADQALDAGTVLVGTTTVTLSCVEVISTGAGLHLAGMYGMGNGLQWTITIRETTLFDVVIVNNAPLGIPTDANRCGIGNAGANGVGAFTIA